MTGSVWDTPRHMQGGEQEPALWNELCMPKSSWLSYPSTVPLTNDPGKVRCRDCLKKMAETPPERRWWNRAAG